MITTTLKRIRDHGPCADGWAKLLKHLGKPRLMTNRSRLQRSLSQTDWMTHCGAAALTRAQELLLLQQEKDRECRQRN